MVTKSRTSRKCGQRGCWAPKGWGDCKTSAWEVILSAGARALGLPIKADLQVVNPTSTGTEKGCAYHVMHILHLVRSLMGLQPKSKSLRAKAHIGQYHTIDERVVTSTLLRCMSGNDILLCNGGQRGFTWNSCPSLTLTPFLEHIFSFIF